MIKQTKTTTESKVDETQTHYLEDGSMVVVPKEYVPPAGNSFTFENFYCEYGRFHMDKTNTLIHIIFIPTIFFTAAAMLSMCDSIKHIKLSPELSMGNFTDDKDCLKIDFLPLVIVGMSTFYFMCEPIIGSLTFLGELGLYMLANKIISVDAETNFSNGDLFRWFLWVHIFAWITQFVGHGVFESKYIPIFLSNLFS